MRLVFPNGEHGQVLLAQGVNSIGSRSDASVVLDQTEVLAAHCEIIINSSGASLVPIDGAEVRINDRPVREMMALRNGDLLRIGTVTARVMALQAASGVAASNDDTDTDATRIRPAMPKLVLRGVTAPVFGKVFPLGVPQVLGRAPECDVPIDSSEISRQHVRLVPGDGRVEVEDLGSANGTFIDGVRVKTGELLPGQELRLDSVRFLLVAPGRPSVQAHAPSARTRSTHRGRWLAVSVVVVALLVIGALLMGQAG